MDARQIQTMRALLATQTTPDTTGAPKRTRGLLGVLTPRPAPWTPVLVPGGGAAYLEPPQQSEAEPVAQIDAPQPSSDPIPSEILLGDLSPRRSAFGQRSEAVLELMEPAPPESRRLILLAADGAAVGEIILHAADMELKAARPRQAIEPLHSQAPFFPEDLEDEPRFHQRRVFGKAALKAVPPPPARPPRELAGVFLLANLAARLASEDAALRQRLFAIQIAGEAA